MYNYCEDGWPEGFNIYGKVNCVSGIVVYPKPTNDCWKIVQTFEISTNLAAWRDTSLKSKVTDKQINLSDLPSGVYFLTIEHDGNTYNKRIIKE